VNKLIKISPNNIVRAHVLDYYATVEEAGNQFVETISPGNQVIVLNASNYNLSGYPRGVVGQWYCDGKSLSHLSSLGTDFFEWRPVFCFDPSHKVGMYFRDWLKSRRWYPEEIKIWNGFALQRWGIKNGVVNPDFNDNNEVNNFLGFGITASRELVIYAVDGWDNHHLGYPSEGVTKTEGFKTMIAAGAYNGGDGGYGGDFYFYFYNGIEGKIVNNWYNDNEPPRVLPNNLCLELLPGTIVLDGETPTEPPVEPPSNEQNIVDIDVNYNDGTSQKFLPQ
jgi:hypothetical protein